MPIITKIAQQKKRKDRYAIYLDEVYAFGVGEDVLIRFQLTKGTTLTEEQVEEITDRDGYQRAYLLAINYLSYRMRTIREMETYLRQKETAPNWLEEVITRLINEKLLDDTVFSHAFVTDRMHYSTKGPRIIEKELMEKGVKRSIATHATLIYEKEAQIEKATKWLEKERRKTTRHSARKREDQLRMKLLQKGFDHEVVSFVFQQNQPEIDMENERLNFTKQADKLYAKHRKKLDGYELRMKIKGSLYQKGFSAELIEEYIGNLVEENE